MCNPMRRIRSQKDFLSFQETEDAATQAQKLAKEAAEKASQASCCRLRVSFGNV